MYKTNSIFGAMDELFEVAYPAALSKSEVRNTEKGFAVDVLLPGFTKDEVKINVEGDDLIIEAKTEKKFPKFLNRNVKKTYFVEDIDADSIKAKLENGILSLEFTTAKKSAAKTISIL